MKFESKISGTKVTDFEITPLFNGQIVCLSEAMKVITRQEAMNFLLDNFRFYKGYEEKEGDWLAILDHDTILKVTILNNYPEYEAELVEYFGEEWAKHYIRFNH